MPVYSNLSAKTSEAKRTVENLLLLRQQLNTEIPVKCQDATMLLATWNIREFDKPSYGDRSNEMLYYIAEIIGSFDLVAVQEVAEDLKGLNRLMAILGNDWKYLVTDVTEGKSGNGERLAFLFDSRKIKFAGLAGEMVLPPLEEKDPVSGQIIYKPSEQLVRTPFMCGFSAGYTNFILSTVHILYGDDEANNPKREKEIRQLAQALANRAKGKTEWSRNIILLGDFNIYSPADITFKAITDAGFEVPIQLQNLPSNAIQSKFYDQVAFHDRENKFEFTGKAGVFNYYKTILRKEDEAIYASAMGQAYLTTDDGKPRKNPSLYYNSYWKTFQLSDHLPMWVEIKIDFSDDYLKKLLV
ncbi:hypothetical protein BH10BAC3_BH10BAC3_20860 [soil metagenome]